MPHPRFQKRTAKLADMQVASIAANEHRDCGVRALSVALDCPYEEAHWLLSRKGRRYRGSTYVDQYERALASAGYSATDVTSQYKARTVRTLERELSSKDVLIVRVRKHALVVRDGLVYDWTQGRCHRILQILRISKKPGRKNTF